MKDHTSEDFLKLRNISEVTLSPDSSMVAFIASNVYREFNGIIEGKVILRDMLKASETVVSEDGTSSSSLCFSPDGTRLAFISSDRKRNHIAIRDIQTGSQEFSRMKGKISSIRWADNSTIIVLAEDYHEDEARRKKEGDDGYFFEEDHKFHSLWRYIPGRGMKKITSGFQIWDFNLNGKKAVAVTSDFPYDWSWYESRVSLIDLETGERSIVYSPEKRQLSSPAFSSDGSRIYFIESLMSDNGVESGDIISLDLGTMEPVNLTGETEKSYSCFHEASDGTIYALANNMGTFEIVALGNESTIWSSHGTVMPAFSPKFSMQGGRFALAFTNRERRQEVITVNQEGREEVVSDVNSDLSDLKTYDSRQVTWKSEDGLEIYGIFRKAADNAPMVVYVHGGPTSSSTENFIDHSTMLLGAGFSVFLPNYRGSTGKGRKYAELNRGDMGGMDFRDIMTGIDHILATEKVDRERIYITGGSYGGFMSAWAITQTDRFRASVSRFGISDWVSFHGVSSLAVWDSIHYDQSPYLFDRFVKFSAIRYLDRVKTPILLMHGMDDPYVPVGQYFQFHRALKELRKDVRLLLFPREGHGFREKKHLEMYISEMIKYFREH